jgi:hypothetical protein
MVTRRDAWIDTALLLAIGLTFAPVLAIASRLIF